MKMANLRNLAVRIVWLFFLLEIRSTLETEKGGSLTVSREQSLCGDWTAFKDEKCFKIADKAGTQTQQDAEIICRALDDDSRGDSTSKLITVKTKEDQEFLKRFLFVENQMIDSVWLGLTKKDENSLFQWNDGSELSFSNWVNQDISAKQGNCVEMESGDSGLAETGVWLTVNCKRKNAVVCEKRPTWTLELLQDTLLNFKLEEEIKRKEMEQKIVELEREKNQRKEEWESTFVKAEEEHNKTKDELAIQIMEVEKEWEHKFMKSEQDITTLRQRDQAFQQEINKLKQTTVPIGFIYIELPGQAPPSTLWPSTKWTDVSSSYSGLFFRVVGGQAAPFGQIQEANTTRLEGVDHEGGYDSTSIVVPPDGSWSKAVASGSDTDSDYLSLVFRLSTSEIRPRNQAVRIWKRIS